MQTLQTNNRPKIAASNDTPHLRRVRRALGAIAGLVLLAMLAACTTTAPAPVRDSAPAASAQAAYAQGSFEQAALMWQREALDAPAPAASGLRVRAADAWLQANEPERAQELLAWIENENLEPHEQARLDLVRADLALRAGRPSEAQGLLQRARGSLAPSSLPRFEDLSARTEEALARPVAKSLEALAVQVTRMTYYDAESTTALLKSLEEIPGGVLALRAANPRAERQLTGWLDLALVVRQNLVRPDGIIAAIGAWKARRPGHLLTEEQALDAWLRYRQTFSRPARIAALLPGSGGLEAAGDALRDGMLSAYVDDPGGAELLLFPTGDDPQSAISSYFNAREAGVDWIIGPLRKESVEAMFNLAGMTTPVLALNDFDETFAPQPELAGQIFGISLSQEQEIAAIAAHLDALGYRRAAVLAPESAWGDRMAAAFEADFLQRNGEIIAAVRYLEAQNDHSAVLRRILKIDESEARKRALENTLQMPLEFEPVRRDDIDVIFMAAGPAQGRQLRPQLNFHDAGDIPVYATGRIYSGEPEPARNQDLDGVRFPAMPWQLEHARESDIPDLASLREGRLAALYALGQDAWQLLPWLELMQKDPDFEFPGKSGAYRVSRAVNLERAPAWAEFRNGIPVALPQVLQAAGRSIGE